MPANTLALVRLPINFIMCTHSHTLCIEDRCIQVNRRSDNHACTLYIPSREGIHIVYSRRGVVGKAQPR